MAFLLSNAFWIAYAWMKGSEGLMVSQLGFTITSLIGIWRWLA